jgi:large subunit ribosomal protein L1
MSLPALRSAARRAIAGPSTLSSVRSLSTTAPVLNKKKKKGIKQVVKHSEDALSLSEAVRVLRALEIGSPSTAFTVEITTKLVKGEAPLRGRVALPIDPRRIPDTIVVFADAESPSGAAAVEAGAHFVGGEELFDKVHKGTINPTKVLCTPSLLPAVTRSLGRFLGPKNLMPNAKRGTVAEGSELGRLIKAAAGAIDWKMDARGVIVQRVYQSLLTICADPSAVARMTFTKTQIEDNVRAFLQAVEAAGSTSFEEILARGKGREYCLQYHSQYTD